ncbi:hypothetical protein [Rhizobiales bacterium]|uniref:hypothetical protein n=1 Tax=Ensifer sp. R-19 TaxID=3404055 RepID=UPI0013AF16D0
MPFVGEFKPFAESSGASVAIPRRLWNAVIPGFAGLPLRSRDQGHSTRKGMMIDVRNRRGVTRPDMKAPILESVARRTSATYSASSAEIVPFVRAMQGFIREVGTLVD